MAFVKRLQALDVDVLDVAQHTQSGLAVVVTGKRRCVQALDQHATGLTVAALELVPHHRHFAIEIFLRNEAVDHAIRFEFKRKSQVVRARRERLVVVGALKARGAIPAHAARGEFLQHIGMLRRPFEHQMFKQVRHARFAVAFVLRANEVRDVDEG